MTHLITALLFCLSLNTITSHLNALEVHASAHAKVPLIIGIKGIHDKNLQEVGNILKKDLMFSEQFSVTVQVFDNTLTKSDIKDLFKASYPIAIFINYADNTHNSIEWRVYDTMNAHMIMGKKYTKRGTTTSGWAHNVTDTLWPILTGQPGFFSTKIAYCKAVPNAKGACLKQIIVSDYNGDNPQLLVDTPTVNIIPRWNNDKNNPLLFYSEYTNANVRMMMITMKKERHIASNFDGINMLASFSPDGQKVVYCASHGDGTCQLYYKDKETFQRLAYTDTKTQKTLLQGNNIAPCLSADNSIVYFCSDFLMGYPQIYGYHLQDKTVTTITHNGYCASPSYCARTNKLAYTKKVKGIMQLYTYDIVTKKHTQLTHDTANKDECSWSPCGNYILVGMEQQGINRIAIYNIPTGTFHYITDAHAQCDYPAWSPVYTVYPTIMT